MYVDAYSIIVQRDGDGGDSLQREGMYAFGKWMRYESSSNTFFISDPSERQPAAVMSKFEVEPGVYVRHPDPDAWYSDPRTTSRDQLVPVIAYCGAYKDYSRLWRLFKAVAQRGFFAQNIHHVAERKKQPKVPDTMLFHLGLFIRSGGYWTAPFYPLLLVTDTLDLIGQIGNLIPMHFEEASKRIRWKEFRDVDDNNTIIAHLLAAKFKPTPVSWLHRQIYSLTRAKNYGNTVLGEANPVMGSLAWYHRFEAGGNPAMAELYRPLVQEYFSPRDDLEQARLKVAMFFSRFKDQLVARR